jgi:hypothetical protein
MNTYYRIKRKNKFDPPRRRRDGGAIMCVIDLSRRRRMRPMLQFTDHEMHEMHVPQARVFK